MSNSTKFTKYVMVRLGSVATLLFLLFSTALIAINDDKQVVVMSIVLFAFVFFVFLFFIYYESKQIQKELMVISKSLKNLNNIEHKIYFYTKEFEDINQNLSKVIKGAKTKRIKQKYNARLKLKNIQRASMLAAIAHELRNPIASIMGYSQTLQDDPEIPQPLQTKFLNKIYNNANKIEILLTRLMLWNKFESEETTLHKSFFNIYTLVEEAKCSLEEKYKTRKIQIEGVSCTVEADRELMEIVLKNLIENALKYSKDKVFVSVKNGSVSVKDSGVGIDSKYIGKVTKKFYRSGTNSWDNSMGLGLSIVKTILTLHKSKLEIQSKIDKGSTFSFKI